MHTSPTDAPGSGDAGGMNVVECHEALALAGLGHRVELITRRTSDDQPETVTLAPGVTLHHLTAGPARRLAKSATDQYIPEFTEALADLDLGGIDLVHSHHWMSGMAALPLARSWGVPHVQSFHSVAATPGSELSDGEPPESSARVPGEALLAQESDLLVAISAAEARIVIERCGADPDRVSIVPPGVDLDLFHPLGGPDSPPEWTRSVLPPDRPFAVVAARLQPLKAPDLAIAALAHVPEQIRPSLVIAGAGSADFPDYEAHLHRLADELGLHGSVHLVGPQSRDDLAWLLRHATLTLVPSHSETFGLVALESAASGTPVVAAATGGLREAVVHGESGRLMDSRQPEDWGVAMTKLLARPDALHRMGTVARVHARRFTWTATVSGLLHLYGDLLDRAQDRRGGRSATRPGASPATSQATRPTTRPTTRPRRYLFVHA
ncbi:MAG: glycosyltransferase, partial [Cellulomonas sp.]|nr:glycosyltransferase [Cellulomonas sp.]